MKKEVYEFISKETGDPITEGKKLKIFFELLLFIVLRGLFCMVIITILMILIVRIDASIMNVVIYLIQFQLSLLGLGVFAGYIYRLYIKHYNELLKKETIVASV